MNLRRNVQRESPIDEYVFCAVVDVVVVADFFFPREFYRWAFLICNFVAFSRYRFIHLRSWFNQNKSHEKASTHTHSSVWFGSVARFGHKKCLKNYNRHRYAIQFGEIWIEQQQQQQQKDAFLQCHAMAMVIILD